MNLARRLGLGHLARDYQLVPILIAMGSCLKSMATTSCSFSFQKHLQLFLLRPSHHLGVKVFLTTAMVHPIVCLNDRFRSHEKSTCFTQTPSGYEVTHDPQTTGEKWSWRVQAPAWEDLPRAQRTFVITLRRRTKSTPSHGWSLIGEGTGPRHDCSNQCGMEKEKKMKEKNSGHSHQGDTNVFTMGSS